METVRHLLITWTLQVVTCAPSSWAPITCQWQPLPAPPPAALLSLRPAHHSWLPPFTRYSTSPAIACCVKKGLRAKNLLVAKTDPQDVSDSNTALLLHQQCRWIQHWSDGKDRFPNHRERAEEKLGRTGENGKMQFHINAVMDFWIGQTLSRQKSEEKKHQIKSITSNYQTKSNDLIWSKGLLSR